MAFDSANSIKISELDSVGAVTRDSDLIPMLDTSTGTTKSIRFGVLTSEISSGLSLTTDDVTEASNLYYTDARVETLVDSAYINARVDSSSSGGGGGTVDSASTIILIQETVDSAYINFRVDYDSETTISIIDSDYINLRVDHPPFDSDMTITVINETVDSAYVNLRVDFDSAMTINIIEDTLDSDFITDTIEFGYYRTHINTSDKDRTITSERNAIGAGPITLDHTVTIDSGATWVIV